MKNTYLLILIAFLSPLCVIAQQIKGKLLTESGATADYANVTIYSLPDTTIIGGMVCDNGEFKFDKLKETPYLLRISLLGYETQYAEKKPTTDETLQQSIVLIPHAHKLGEVIVSTNRPTISYSNGKLKMRVQNTVLSNIGDANDLLKQLPEVITSGDDELTVFGKGTPVIYINNKRVQDNAELTVLRSEDIESMELIQNPGAKYDNANKRHEMR